MQRIRELRIAKKWTQTELAKRAGIARQTLNEIEQGKQNVTLRLLQSVAVALNVEVAELLKK